MTANKVNSLELEMRLKHFFVASSTTNFECNKRQTMNTINKQPNRKMT